MTTGGTHVHPFAVTDGDCDRHPETQASSVLDVFWHKISEKSIAQLFPPNRRPENMKRKRKRGEGAHELIVALRLAFHGEYVNCPCKQTEERSPV